MCYDGLAQRDLRGLKKQQRILRIRWYAGQRRLHGVLRKADVFGARLAVVVVLPELEP